MFYHRIHFLNPRDLSFSFFPHLIQSSLEQYQQDVAKTQRYEQEIKEKNLLIGKLRHEGLYYFIHFKLG